MGFLGGRKQITIVPMKIGILGSGPSALYAAILLKKRHPSYMIDIFDKEEKLAKKLRATGNGHANIMPDEENPFAYNDPKFMESLLSSYPLSKRIEAFHEMGVSVNKKEGQGYYPTSDNANQFASYLLDVASSFGIVLHRAVTIKDYEKKEFGYYFLTSNVEYGPYDTLIIAPGARSGNNLGSDGNFVSVLEKHHYRFDSFRPGLCPIMVTDRKMKELSGIRHAANVSLSSEGKSFFSQRGEVLYKDDGLSGIVIMNASSEIARRKLKDVTIYIDLFPNKTHEEMCDEITKMQKVSPHFFLDSLLPHPLANHVLDRAKRTHDVEWIPLLARTMKGLDYCYKENYPFLFSQVSVGGLKLDQIESTFESKIEKSVYFAGEILNIDGECGGYNLLFNLLNALRIADSL